MKFDIPDLQDNGSEPSSYIPGAIFAVVIGGGILVLFLISLFS